MSGSRYFTPNPFEVDATGVPVAGGKLFFFQTGTSTPLDTFADVGLTIANPNPVVADSSGHYGTIWLSQTQAYKVISTDQNGVQIWTADPVGPAAGGAAADTAGIIGEVRAYAGIASTIPAQWQVCGGQAVSRTTFSAAFAVLGTTWGVGDGSTTFNLPDLRGRVMAGLDNMGGTAAGRLTAGVSGMPGTTLGGVGGSQNAQADTLTATSTVTDPGHMHLSLASGPPVSNSTNFIAGGTASSLTPNQSTDGAATGITVATTVTSTLTGASQNVQPTAMVNFIIFLGA